MTSISGVPLPMPDRITTVNRLRLLEILSASSSWVIFLFRCASCLAPCGRFSGMSAWTSTFPNQHCLMFCYGFHYTLSKKFVNKFFPCFYFVDKRTAYNNRKRECEKITASFFSGWGIVKGVFHYSVIMTVAFLRHALKNSFVF